MARQYRQTTRRESLTDTRLRVLRAAGDLFAARGYVDVTIDDIAHEARVARATIYQHFGSKAGMLDGLCELVAAAGVLDQVRAALRLPDPRQALVRGVEMGTQFWASDHELFRSVYAVALMEPGALRFVDLQRADHRSEMEGIIGRLDEAGALRADLSRHDATEALVALTGFHFYDELTHHGGLDPDAAVGVVVAMAQALLAPARARRVTRTPGCGLVQLDHDRVTEIVIESVDDR